MLNRALWYARRKIRALHIRVTSQMGAQQWRYWGASVGRGFRAYGGLDLSIEGGTKIQIGNDVIMRPGVRVQMQHGSHLIIEDKVEIKNNVCIEVVGKLILRKNCLLVNGTLVYAIGHIEVGENTMIAGHCALVDSNHGMEIGDVPMKLQALTPPQPIYIGEDVWIGAGTQVLNGVTIGAHSIVGANSVVNRSLPAYSVAVGAPAKVLRDRREPSALKP